MESVISLDSFSNFKDNPLALLSFISKYAKVHLIKNTTLQGHIYSIDPLTSSVILLVPKENDNMSLQTVIIPGHAINNITVENSESQLKAPLNIPSNLNYTDIQEKKIRLLQWFRSNLLTVTESGENIIFGNVTILPPYNSSDICTDNAIVAMQVKKVMEKLPEDFKSDFNNEVSVNKLP